jgi:hypothetical protein
MPVRDLGGKGTMNVKLTEIERDAVRALLLHRSRTIRERGAGYVATDLANRYARLADVIAAANVRKGAVSLRLTRADGNRLESLIAHDCSPVLRPVLVKIHDARRPKDDPRRANGRRVRQEVA